MSNKQVEEESPWFSGHTPKSIVSFKKEDLAITIIGPT